MNSPAEPYSAPESRPPARGTWLGVISLLVGLTLLAPPLSVVYEMNDESRRTATVAAPTDLTPWQTLYTLPPLSVPRGTYLAVRTVAIAAATNALFLCAIGVATIRSREVGVRLLAVFAVAEVTLMLAMIYAAHRFTVALDAATASRVWFLGAPFGSATRGTAVVAALPGIVYSLVLLWLFVRHRRSGRAIRPV